MYKYISLYLLMIATLSGFSAFINYNPIILSLAVFAFSAGALLSACRSILKMLHDIRHIQQEHSVILEHTLEHLKEIRFRQMDPKTEVQSSTRYKEATGLSGDRLVELHDYIASRRHTPTL